MKLKAIWWIFKKTSEIEKKIMIEEQSADEEDHPLYSSSKGEPAVALQTTASQRE